MARALDLRQAPATFLGAFQFSPEASVRHECDAKQNHDSPRGQVSPGRRGQRPSVYASSEARLARCCLCLPGGGTGQTVDARRLRIPPGVQLQRVMADDAA
jgi:hypothetical protein